MVGCRLSSTVRHKDGKLTDVLFNGSVYKDDRGKVIGVVLWPEILPTKRGLQQN